MTTYNSQNEPNLPLSNKERRTSANLLPRFYRTDSNKKFLQATLDQLIQPGTVKKVNGYIGRQNAKAVTSGDIFLAASDQERQNYQLEPAAVIQDFLGNTTFYKDYIDHINHIEVFGGNVSNHQRLNKQEFYSWNPNIDWDKFVNYQNYYWLPYGPDSIDVAGKQQNIESTYTVGLVDEVDNFAYLFSPDGLTRNPTLTLYRGEKYIFDITAPGAPFTIKSSRVAGDLEKYTDGVSDISVEKGRLVFEVPLDAPDVLYYVNDNDVNTGGVFHVLDITENTFLDVEKDVLGKKEYTLPSGIKLSNGMKVNFTGKITPEKYSTGFWYVEGVGTAIKLINQNDLEILSGYSSEQALLFDDEPFDLSPFSTATSFAKKKDYYVVNRSSPDGNAWSRYNRWFHQDVIRIAAEASGQIPQFDQTARATRPIIEYNAGLKLYNFGHKKKRNVDVIDTDTLDVFSIVEGSLGYNVDGIDLAEGMRVLFAADTDRLVNGRIFKVNYIEAPAPGRTIRFNAANVDAVKNTITFEDNHGLATGTQLSYLTNGNIAVGGLLNRKIYYVWTVDAKTIQLLENDNNLNPDGVVDFLNPNAINITEASTGFHAFEVFSGLRRQLEFNASTQVDTVNNIISFNGSHRLTTGSRVLYLNSDNENIGGLIDGKAYYVFAVSTTQVQLFSDTKLQNEVDITSLGQGTHKLESFAAARRQINLIEEPDSIPLLYETILINQGEKNQGLMYWYNGSQWVLGQNKSEVNQNPLFDLFDENGVSFSDISAYDGSTFAGNKIFSYKIGTGATDKELGFALSYQNINNIGDITFQFNLLNDQFNYKLNNEIVSKNTDIGYLRNVIDLDRYTYLNGWITSEISNSQPIVRIFKESGLVNNFPIDVYDRKDQLNDLEVRVYINGRRLDKNTYRIEDGLIVKSVVLDTDVKDTDVVTLKCYAAQAKNQNGYYEIPINLQNNPLNDNLNEFTLGQVIDHVDSIIDNISIFEGSYPGNSNLRDLGNITPYGTRFVQHSSPLNMSLYHFGSQSSNVFSALAQARDDYGKFKRAFIVAASNSGIDADPKIHVDYVLSQLSKDKSKNNPYYLSDMYGVTGSTRTEYVVLDSRTRDYPLKRAFDLNTLSNSSILIYLNGEQLVHGKDYVFSSDIYFTILCDIAEDDLIEVFEYESTDGCFCPPTPTKLGLYPKFEPKKFIDDTYLEPVEVIQGHDGSITIAFGDYRDDMILELEKRIFNNIKAEYNSSLFDIYDYLSGYNRAGDYSKEEIEKVLSAFFFQWTVNINQDYTRQRGFDRLNPFTFNYRDNYAPDGRDLPAFWRGIYKWLYDTDRPHLCPWEMLGFSEQPSWWIDVYGEAPYTSDNFILWDDLRQGILRVPGRPVEVLKKFVRPVLSEGLPVDENGNLVNPILSNMATGFIKSTAGGFYVFGDQGPVETAWRRSSYFPFSLLQAALLLQPNKVLGTCFDVSRIGRNLSGQLIYKETGLRIRLSDLVLPSTANSSERIQTSGLVNYVVDYITSDVTDKIDRYKEELASLTNRLGSKLGGFSSKSKFRLLLDSKSPTSSGSIFVPEENYNIILNTSSPIKKLVYSGVIVTRFPDGYEIKGYNTDDPYFNYYTYLETDRLIKVGAISESFVNWESERFYTAGKIVKYNNQFWRTKTNHQSGSSFNEANYTRLPELPTTGGKEALLRRSWDKNNIETIVYGTKLSTIQDVVDFLQGYGVYLEDQGFIFDDYNPNVKAVSNWETMIKEFMFWTLHNWSTGQEKWVDWTPNIVLKAGDIVKYDSEYYKATVNALPSETFISENFIRLSDLDTSGASIISLSPAAGKLTLKTTFSVVNNVKDPFYKYQIFRVDGQKLEPEFTNTFRNLNEFSLIPGNTNHGIYGATLYLIQKEHVLILDNRTMFNDIIYDLEPGYRQERVKAVGYISKNWNGGFDIPGFIFDDANIKSWEPWTDYNLGDLVKYKEFYYTANKFLPGVETFEAENWTIQEEKPVSRMISNWDYTAEQFTDFYDLDTDNFNSEQQKLAQHLIGYQKRQYLENIIQDDVSQYKFYQGMIIEKGTQNVFNKLFDVLSADNQESLTFNEEWAVRVGQYGSTESFNEIEFKLDESKFKLNPQPFELVDFIDPNLNDFVYRQRPQDLYIKPIGYDNNPWKTDGTKDYLRTPGYVRYEDVKIYIDKLEDIKNYDISSFKEGDYIWTAFEGRNNWDVYRFTKTSFSVEDIEYNAGTEIINIRCSRIPELKAGDIIGIENVDSIKGFHTISSVNSRNIRINTKVIGWQQPFEDSSQVLTYKLILQRVSDIDQGPTNLPINLKTNELLWADNIGGNKWGVYKNNKVFVKSNIESSAPDFTLGQNFGKKVSISKNGTTAIVTDSDQISIFEQKDKNTWYQAQIIFKEGVGSEPILDLGEETAISEDAVWIALSAKSKGFVKLYKKGRYGYELVSNVNPLPIFSENFGHRIKFAKRGQQYLLAVSAIDASDAKGTVYLYKSLPNVSAGNAWTTLDSAKVGTAAGDRYGYDISWTDNGNVLAISSPQAQKVRVYKWNDSNYQLTQTLETSTVHTSRFGESVSVSSTGKYIAVGQPFAEVNSYDEGQVVIFKDSGESYIVDQIIDSPTNEIGEQYGSHVDFMNDDQTLVILSTNGDVLRTTTFDSYENSVLVNSPTTFDNGTLTVRDKNIDTGRVDIYDRYNTKFVFGESLDTDAASLPSDRYGFSVAVGKDKVLVGAPSDADDFANQGSVYSYYKEPNTKSWTLVYSQTFRPNINKIKKAFLYNRKTSELVKYLDVIDVTQGKIPGPADQEIKYKTYFDPAVYSVGNSSVNVDLGLDWTNEHVGMLWWDLSRAKFLDSQVGGLTYRTTAWNRLYDTASIDIYEWVETRYTPSQWNRLADTEKGLVQGISGTTRYGDDVYSVKKRYDSISQTFINTYYFWVKNKTTIPNVIGRSLSAKEVSDLITDPVGSGYTCLALTGSNSFSLVNAQNFLDDADINLSVQTWLIDNRNANAHSQWKIISENPNTVIPRAIEEKWFHSLIGKDDKDRVVPDLNLPFKQRYGIENRPRQGMFVNRIEALKQFIERVNASIKNKVIVDDRDLTDLEQFDPEPSNITGLWDRTIDTDAELRFVPTAFLKQAVLQAIVIDGKITGVNVVDGGFGYINPPYIKISGEGTGAELRSILENGKIVDVEVINPGNGYLISTTLLSVRPFAVLVKSDSSTFDKWRIYHWDKPSLTWNKSKGQAFDVTRFWTYIDWYADGYNQFTNINHVVENTYQLVSLDADIGEIVKVMSVGSGGWMLLEKYSDVSTIDYTQNYSVIGRQNGTIKFLENLYTFKGTLSGFDGSLFDAAIYDDSAVVELRIILDAIKNKILVDELRQDYLKLFFSSLRYVLHEQTFADWVFKTSFVKATHNVGELTEKVTYKSDNLENFEDYVNEVKPYRTKIREYVSSYNKLDNAYSSITDFDIIPTVDQNLDVEPIRLVVNEDGTINSSSSDILSYPWKHWFDNVGFSIQTIEIVDGGSGYITQPVVRIEGGFGSGALAKAYISSGRVNRIELISAGTGYLKSPTIILDGGVGNGGTIAKAVAIIESEVVRANKIGIKFDRVTKNYFISEINETETFVGTGSRLQFALKWSPRLDIGKSVVTVNGDRILTNDFILTKRKVTDRSYTKYSGVLTLTEPPAEGAIVSITYEKDFNHLSATDRINFFYNPTTGQYGKDLAQLMTGVDYGGVSVVGLGFDVNGGWGTTPWFQDSWDSIESDYKDQVFTTGANTHTFSLSYTPAIGEQVNVYHVGRIVNTHESDGSSTVFEFNSTIESPKVEVVIERALIKAQNQILLNSKVITLDSVQGLQVGDFVTIPAHESLASPLFRYFNSAAISSIDEALNQVTLSLSLLKEIPNNSVVVFTRNITTLSSVFEAGNLRLEDPVAEGAEIRISGLADPVRIDDLYYGTPQQTNDNAVMLTFIGDGETSQVTIPEEFIINQGDQVILRKSTSDGSNPAQDNNYDTSLSGGSLEKINGVFSTASGFAPDDIVVDGDGLITPMNSNAPEEVVPGHIVDAVAIKVFHRPRSYAPKILFRNQVADGISNEYLIGQQFQTNRSVIVKLADVILDQTEYTIDWQNNQVIFNEAPLAGQMISIISIGFNGTDVLDLDYFVADGSTVEFITKAPWIENNISATVLVNGSIVNYQLFRTDESYDSPSLVGIRFAEAVSPGAVINYVIKLSIDENTTFDTSSVTKSQIINFDGSTKVFSLENLNSTILSEPQLAPYEPNVIVKKGNQILRPPVIVYFTMKDGNLTYPIPKTKFAPYGIRPLETKAYINNEEIQYGRDFQIDSSGIDVLISKFSYVENGKLTVVFAEGADYFISNDGNISFQNAFNEGETAEIITFYNHKVLEIERTSDLLTPATQLVPGTSDYFEFTGKLGGRFVLRNPAISDDYVWIIKNGTLLTHSVDYFLDEDFITVKLADPLTDSDVIQVMSFSDTVTKGSFGYMQFKDMLNRVHYKRLNQSKSTRLAKDLLQDDLEITVTDGTKLTNPNRAINLPGIIEINGERIEYFRKNGNVLSQLRRGTLGTGVPNIHRLGLIVLDLGITETIPYQDSIYIENTVSDNSTSVYNLEIAPMKEVVENGGDITTSLDWKKEYSAGFESNIPAGHIQADDVDVFVEGIRLRKSPFKRFVESNGYPYSPEGDSQFDAEFSVDGSSNSVRINIPLEDNTRITVVRKQGRLWNDSGVSLVDSNNQIANFLKNTETIWPQYLVDKYQYVVVTDDGRTLLTDQNNPLELD